MTDTPRQALSRSPWYITGKAVRDYAALLGRSPLPTAGSEFDRIKAQLAEFARRAVDRSSPKHLTNGLLSYRVRKRENGREVSWRLLVSTAPHSGGPLPQLVAVVPGWHQSVEG